MDGEPKCECPVGDCEFSFAQSSAGYGYLTAHIRATHPIMATYLSTTRTHPRIQRPTINSDRSPALWETFVYEWEDCSGEYGLPDNSRTAQFMHCLNSDLKQKVHTRVADYRQKLFDKLILAVKSLAIKPVTIGK